MGNIDMRTPPLHHHHHLLLPCPPPLPPPPPPPLLQLLLQLLLGGKIQIANYLCPGNYAVSGSLEAAKVLEEIAKPDFGARMTVGGSGGGGGGGRKRRNE